MDLGRRRSTGGRATTSVVAGSVWESRMKLDEVKGGFKVFNGEHSNTNNNTNEETVVGSRVKRGGSITSNASPSPSGKRKTWKSETFEGFERSPIQIARGVKASGDDHGLSVSADGIKKSPIQAKRAARSEAGPAAVRRPRPKANANANANANAAKPDSAAEEEAEGIGIEVVEKVEIGCGEACREFGVCEEEEEEEKVGSSNVEATKCGDLEENEEEIEVVGEEEEIEVVEDEEKGIEIKEIKAQETNLEGNEEEEIEVVEEEEEIEVVEDEEKGIEIKEIKTPQISKPDKGVALATSAEKVVVSEVKRVSFERKLDVRNNNKNNNKVVHQKQAKSETIALNVRKQSPVIKRATIHSTFSTSRGSSTKFPSTSASHQHHGFPETHCRLQSFVDLIMWKDISRSVFIFGIGTFTILSSSYTKDLNISFISVISYLGLVYLATIFFFRSIVCRGVIDMDYTSYVVGEEEAIWILKLVLPYLNEFLLKLKALFSGDPATTMKLAALLFVLARCGSSITIWTMAKLGFFGVFTVPKVCSLYSTHITAYAKFWVRRFRDAWDSCSHKKGVTVAVFLLVWNLSSIIARIWAVFMLFVAFRYYQQNLVADDWMEDGEEGEETWHEPIGDQRQGPGPTIVDYTKQKKRS